MITSMTGFGRGEAANDEGISVIVEVRSVNSRFFEVSNNASKRFQNKELELRELIKKKISRGKISVSITVENTENGDMSSSINPDTVERYYNDLTGLRKKLKIRESVKLEHLLLIPDLYKNSNDTPNRDEEWDVVCDALADALAQLNAMRRNEGKELARDLHKRMKTIERNMEKIEKISSARVPQERQRLRERIAKLFESDEIDEHRLELEIVLLADKLDISEECVRMRSHIKFFYDALKSKEQAGRKLNFLLQETGREINTIGSKSNDAEISHLAVAVKEELECIREQVQNIE